MEADDMRNGKTKNMVLWIITGKTAEEEKKFTADPVIRGCPWPWSYQPGFHIPPPTAWVEVRHTDCFLTTARRSPSWHEASFPDAATTLKINWSCSQVRSGHATIYRNSSVCFPPIDKQLVYLSFQTKNTMYAPLHEAKERWWLDFHRLSSH